MIGPVLLFVGYSLIYAAVAKGGKFATDPWNGLFSDAYVDLPDGDTIGEATGLGTPTSTLTPNPPAGTSLLPTTPGFNPTSTLTPTPPSSFSRPRHG